MSRIGKQLIEIPEKVAAKITGRRIEISGSRGVLKFELPAGVSLEIKDGQISVLVADKTKSARALHGTVRALVANMVKGVAEGWAKQMELVGTGYRAEVVNGNLVLAVGYSHPVEIKAPEGIIFKVEKTTITVEGADKALVGQTCARIRAVRPPEPYKGKGIIYVGEVVRRKAGKAAKTQGVTA